MIKPIVYEFAKEALWKGRYVSVRSDKVEEAFKAKKPLLIKWKKRFMIVGVEQLPMGIVSKDLFKSKHGLSSYRLIDYEWNETPQPAKELSKLF